MRTTRMIIPIALFTVLTTVSRSEKPYAGQENRDIKALSGEDIAAYRKGGGMGMAKAAELNGYPGPKHVLELSDSLRLDSAQVNRTRKIFQDMQTRAQDLGKTILQKETELELVFRSGKAGVGPVDSLCEVIGKLNGRLRSVHLAAHLEMKAAMSQPQIMKYRELRGYGEGSHREHDPHHHGHSH